MTNISTIAAETRDRAGKGAARATRRDGKVPGVIYGAKAAAVCIALDPRVIWSERNKPGFKTRLFEVDLGKAGKERCLVRDIQFHPVTDQPIHIDFLRVAAGTLIHVKVPVHLLNADKSPGVKRGGVINLELHEIEVTCIPDAIPASFDVDLAEMDIGAAVHVSQLKLPEGVTPYHTTSGATVMTIAAPTVQQVETPAASAT